MSSFPQNGYTKQSCWSCLDNSNQARMSPPTSAANIIMPLENELKEAEDLMASEMNKLSFQERSEALNDVHCVGEDIQETESIKGDALASFEAAVQKEDNSLYKLALDQNRAYVEDPSFRLLFLRAQLFDVEKSVQQLMSFLHQKATYFGEDKLARDITLDDLNSEEIALMKSGFYHIQDGRDRMGRVVLICFKNMISKRWAHAELMNRVVFYLTMNILLSIPEVQLKGVVTIQLNAKKVDEPPVQPSFAFIQACSNLSNSLPLRCSALHSSFDTLTGNPAVDKAVLGLWHLLVPEYTRSRIRLHCGSHLELIYQLGGYGIAMDSFPVDSNGDTRKDILNVWFDEHVETIQHPSARAENGSARPEPGRIQDVLLGRGRAIQAHPGNARFRKFLEAHQNEYEESPRFTRHAVAARFVRTFMSNGVRFLHRADNGVWVESRFEDAERKVGQYFRELRKRGKSAAKK